MLPSYDDIRSRIDMEPLWFDAYGVPRYDVYKPDMLGVYDRHSVLVSIRCQSCHKPFNVGVSTPSYSFVWGQDDPVIWTLEKLVTGFHYGDPPRHGCVGDTMNCEDDVILEAWTHTISQGWGWERHPEFEGPIHD